MTDPIAIKNYEKVHACIGRPIKEVVKIAAANWGRVVQTATDEQRKYVHYLPGADWCLRVRTVRGVVVKVGD